MEFMDQSVSEDEDGFVYYCSWPKPASTQSPMMKGDGELFVRYGIHNPITRRVLSSVPRESFLPSIYSHLGYIDCPIPIGSNRYTESLYTAGQLLEAADLTGTDQVLVCGTGSGYLEAVTAAMTGWVHSMEPSEQYYEEKVERLHRLGIKNVTITHPGQDAWSSDLGPFDVILLSGYPNPYFENLPEEAEENEVLEHLINKLSANGRMIYILGERDDEDNVNERLVRITRLSPQAIVEEVSPLIRNIQPLEDFSQIGYIFHKQPFYHRLQRSRPFFVAYDCDMEI